MTFPIGMYPLQALPNTIQPNAAGHFLQVLAVTPLLDEVTLEPLGNDPVNHLPSIAEPGYYFTFDHDVSTTMLVSTNSCVPCSRINIRLYHITGFLYADSNCECVQKEVFAKPFYIASNVLESPFPITVQMHSSNNKYLVKSPHPLSDVKFIRNGTAFPAWARSVNCQIG